MSDIVDPAGYGSWQVIAVEKSKFYGPNGYYYATDITVGRRYTALYSDTEEYLIQDDSGNRTWHNAKHFRLVDEVRNDKIDKVLT